MSLKLNFTILAPSNIESGGPELAHQMCHELTLQGQNAKMYYVNHRLTPENVPCCQKYHKYNTEHISSYTEYIPETSILIVPEGLPDWIISLNARLKLFWWMSIDNFTDNYSESVFEKILDCTDLHLVQSYYAYHFLITHNVPQEKILFVRDYIDEQYGQFLYPGSLRKNNILYNPKKGLSVLQPLIDHTKDEFCWIPLINYTEEELIILMQSSKIYIDFGKHPGKDRIPREAASCGCCIITNTQGSAAFFEDVSIPECYKFKHPELEHENIINLIRDIFLHYENHLPDFADYRNHISNEKTEFVHDVTNCIQTIQKMLH